jgi:hypothetical protein
MAMNPTRKRHKAKGAYGTGIPAQTGGNIDRLLLEGSPRATIVQKLGAGLIGCGLLGFGLLMLYFVLPERSTVGVIATVLYIAFGVGILIRIVWPRSSGSSRSKRERIE